MDDSCPSCKDHEEVSYLFAALTPETRHRMRREARSTIGAWHVTRHLTADQWLTPAALGLALGLTAHAAAKAVSYARSVGAAIEADRTRGYRLRSVEATP